MKKRTIAAAAIPLLVWALWPGLQTTTYTIESDKLAAGQQLRLALVSDLHSCIHGDHQSGLLDRIREAKPDAILMSGDIYDDETDPEGVHLLLEGLRDTVPCYYVTGNHEWWTDDVPGILELFESYGVTVVENRWVETELAGVPVAVAGVSDPRSGTDTAAEAARMAAEIPDDRLRILLAHRPERWEEYTGFDLAVSGHAHGGQVRIPGLLNGLYAPNQGFFPAYAGGAYAHGRMTHVVSRGLSINPRLPRVWNRPELVLIDLIPKEV